MCLGVAPLLTRTAVAFAPLEAGAENATPFTVEVKANGAVPSGRVLLYATGCSRAWCPSLDGSGSGTYTLSPSQFPAGAYLLTAWYEPSNGDFLPSVAVGGILTIAAARHSTSPPFEGEGFGPGPVIAR